MVDFFGAPYPIVKTARGLLATQTGIEQVKADLLQLLLTNPGERVMLLGYGTPLRELIFEPNDTILASQAREMIANSIATWEPRITIEQIEVLAEVDESSLDKYDLPQDSREHILMIRILFFDPENIGDLQELKLEVPLAGTAGA